MYIKQIDNLKVEIPMVTSFTTSFGTITSKPTIITMLKTNDGYIGYGEGAALPFPHYKPDTTDITLLVLKNYIAPLILNKEFSSIDEFMDFLKPIKNHNFAKTAVENAVWMILSLKANKPLKELLGGTQSKIPVGESLGIKNSIDETLNEVELRLSQGFRRIKLKIKPGWDVELVRAVRNSFKDIDLMVDANSSYTLDDLAVLKQLDEYKLTMTEQPLADDDIIDHATLQRNIKTPICLDESIHSAEDTRKAISIDACKIINIKPGRVGGLLESKKIHDLCKKHNIGVWCGGMLETGIGRAYNIAVASLPKFIYPSDMSPVHFFYKDDLVKDSFVVDKNGYVKVPTEPGLGFEIDIKKINMYTRDKVILK